MSLDENVELYLQAEFAETDSAVLRDLSLNFRKLMNEGALAPSERMSTLLAIAVALQDSSLAKLAQAGLRQLGVGDELIREAAEAAGIMGMNNVYHKFRGFLPDEAKSHYTRAGLRMQSIMTTIHPKAEFELLALAVSIVNACPACIASHEKSARELGVPTEKIHDLARLAAVSKGLSSLKTARIFLS